MKYTIYDLTTGTIKRSGELSYDDLSGQIVDGENEGIISGIRGDWNTEYVVSGSVVPIEVSLEDQKRKLIARLAERRWEVETSGTLINNIFVATDDRSKIMLTGAYMAATANPEFTTIWKTDTAWITLDVNTIKGIYFGVAEHINKCFCREKTILDIINGSSDVAECSTIVERFTE